MLLSYIYVYLGKRKSIMYTDCLSHESRIYKLSQNKPSLCLQRGVEAGGRGVRGVLPRFSCISEAALCMFLILVGVSLGLMVYFC